MNKGNRVVIKYDRDTGEYRVPGPDGTEAQAYYTDDKLDAIMTAKYIHGKDITDARNMPEIWIGRCSTMV